nr:butyrophilin-like protein 1 [Microcebus murinus]
MLEGARRGWLSAGGTQWGSRAVLLLCSSGKPLPLRGEESWAPLEPEARRGCERSPPQVQTQGRSGAVTAPGLDALKCCLWRCFRKWRPFKLGTEKSSSEEMENCSSHLLLCRLASLLLVLQLPTWASADEFLVIGPWEPVVAVLGGDATLPCSLSPASSAEDMELRWFRGRFSDAVLVYRNRREQSAELMAQYAGRTSLVTGGLARGEAAVRIRHVRASDHGMYTCFFRKGAFYQDATLELKVAGVGSAPHVRIEGPEDGGVRVLCTASGWFPKPQVQWRDVSGERFLGFSEAHAQDAEELFSVEAALVVRDSSVGNVTCSVLNPVLGQEKATAVFIPEPFFPQASPWKPAFAVTMVTLGVLLFGAGYFIQRERATKLQERQEGERLRREKEEDRKAREQARKAGDELQADLERRKDAYMVAWRKAQLYADWRTEQFQPVSDYVFFLWLPSCCPFDFWLLPYVLW